MFADRIEIIIRAMRPETAGIIQVKLPSGRSISGWPRRTYTAGTGIWVPRGICGQTENPFLIDSGRLEWRPVLEMLRRPAFRPQDLKGLLLSMAIEDHDGAWLETEAEDGVPVWVHPVYEHLSRSYPQKAPSSSKATFSPLLAMYYAESFTRTHCVGLPSRPDDA